MIMDRTIAWWFTHQLGNLDSHTLILDLLLHQKRDQLIGNLDTLLTMPNPYSITFDKNPNKRLKLTWASLPRARSWSRAQLPTINRKLVFMLEKIIMTPVATRNCSQTSCSWIPEAHWSNLREMLVFYWLKFFIEDWKWMSPVWILTQVIKHYNKHRTCWKI